MISCEIYYELYTLWILRKRSKMTTSHTELSRREKTVTFLCSAISELTSQKCCFDLRDSLALATAANWLQVSIKSLHLCFHVWSLTFSQPKYQPKVHLNLLMMGGNISFSSLWWRNSKHFISEIDSTAKIQHTVTKHI